MNYVFYLLANWCFLYLVQERHFTVLESGWLSRRATAGCRDRRRRRRLGSRRCFGGRSECARGCGIIPLLSLPPRALLQFLAVDAPTPISPWRHWRCASCVELNEGPYWTAIMHVGRADTMAASAAFSTPAATSAA